MKKHLSCDNDEDFTTTEDMERYLNNPPENDSDEMDDWD